MEEKEDNILQRQNSSTDNLFDEPSYNYNSPEKKPFYLSKAARNNHFDGQKHQTEKK